MNVSRFCYVIVTEQQWCKQSIKKLVYKRIHDSVCVSKMYTNERSKCNQST